MKIIGLISGTSADGIDAALCEIHGEANHLTAKILHAETIPYPPALRERIIQTYEPEISRVDEITRLNVAIAEVFAEAALHILQVANIAPSEIDLIGSHGQTVWHDVNVNGSVQATLQLGEAAVIAERTGVTTVNNFRARDISAGGQGAPLAAYLDWLLLRHPEHWRAAQNIGGVGNVTFLPPKSDTTSDAIAFDTGPGNGLIDLVVTHYTNGKQTYDRDAAMARDGNIDKSWLQELLQHPYYTQPAPKTTGRELFGAPMAQQLIAEGAARNLSHEDVVATLTALTAYSIADAYHRFAPAAIMEVVIGGGGQHNPVIMETLREQLHPAKVHTHQAVGMDGDFKEALIFALLAHETWHGRIGTLPSLTGAKHATVLGQITPGENYLSLIQQTWGQS